MWARWASAPRCLRTRGPGVLVFQRAGVNTAFGAPLLWQPRISFSNTVQTPTTLRGVRVFVGDLGGCPAAFAVTQILSIFGRTSWEIPVRLNCGDRDWVHQRQFIVVNKQRENMKKCIASVAILLAGCANPGVVQLSPDTYILSREDHAGIFGSSSSLMAGVIADANAFATSQGKVAIPISTQEKPVGNTPGSWAKFDYQFRVVDKNDPEVRRTSLVKRADVVIEKTEKISADVRTKDQTSKPKDTYSELIKLDDLRKRGILSETEFAAQKQKLLNSSD